MPIKVYDATWRALARETALAARLVGTGLGALHRAEAANAGLYYEGFFGVTIGLERLCKLVIVVSDYVTTGAFPTDAELKSRYGHDLSTLVKEVGVRLESGKVTSQWPIPDDEEHIELMALLTDFAKISRYYNLSALSGGMAPADDPIPRWFDLVLKHHPQPPLTQSQRRNLVGFELIDHLVGARMHVLHSDEHGGAIGDIVTGARYGIKVEHVQRQGTMMCVRLVRPVADALASLSYARPTAKDEIPVFSEFLTMFLNEDSYLRTRRTFNYPR